MQFLTWVGYLIKCYTCKIVTIDKCNYLLNKLYIDNLQFLEWPVLASSVSRERTTNDEWDALLFKFKLCDNVSINDVFWNVNIRFSSTIQLFGSLSQYSGSFVFRKYWEV